jgi:hypothetical protein
MAERPNRSKELEEGKLNIESILNAIFRQKPRGGGGRVGRWYMMRSLGRYIMEAPNHEVFYRDIIYAWSAQEGIRPDTAETLLEHFSMISSKDGQPIIEIEGTSPKIVRWVYGVETQHK